MSRLFRPAGDVFMCCWLKSPPLGNILHQSLEEIWNGEIAQEIRRSILDGSFQYCDHTGCPFLQSISCEVKRLESVTGEELKNIINNNITILPYGPRNINCGYDRSCNLSCPTCRTEIIVERSHECEILNVQSKLEYEALKGAHVLSISGSGDPFGSPYYRRWLQTMKREKIPCLEQIILQTNALLWTPTLWITIPEEIRKLVKSAVISIDAARSETYSINRSAGSFEKLLKNLEFISLLRKHGPLENVKISMVVQKNNFLEMSEFIQLGKQYNFDSVSFSQLVNWSTFSEQEFRERAVHLPNNPLNTKLINVLQNEMFNDPIVDMGNLSGLM
jgi:MoaA/NifB/PqqE/SkfB family radical SAM enzyme